MKSIDDIRIWLDQMEADFDSHPEAILPGISTCTEVIIRNIITQCYQLLKNRNDVGRMKKVENAICGESLSYQNLGLGQLVRFWHEAKIYDLWAKVNNMARAPAIFKGMPFNEIIDARNPQLHHALSVSKHSIKRFFFSVVEFLDTAFPEDSIVEAAVDCVSLGKQKVHHNLPRMEHEFVGRDKEIAQIMGWLSRGSRTWMVSITGVGGVGKSALALEVASRFLQQETSGESSDTDLHDLFNTYVWTSAKKKALIDNKVQRLIPECIKSNLEDILTEIIRVLAPDTYKHIPDSMGQYEIVKRLLSENRVLLIVDNMETIEDLQIMAFLRDLPSPSKAIITDRRSVQSSQPIRLTELSHEEAVQLIRDQCEPRRILLSEEQMNHLAKKTGYIPLAIIWAIGQMSAKGLGPEGVTERLSKAGESPVLEFLFSETFNHISKHAKNILLALSLTESAVPGRMLLEWTQLGKEDCEDAIAELVEYALVLENSLSDERCSSGGRLPILNRTYRLLPLTRNFVKNQKYNKQDSFRREITHSLFRMLANAEDNPEWPSLKTIDTVDTYNELFTWAMENAFEQEDYPIVLNLMRYIGYALGIRGHHDRRLKLGKMAIEAARRLERPLEMARNLIMNVGWVYFIWYKFEECESAEKEGLYLAQQIGDLRMEGIAIRTLALVKKEKGFFAEAEPMLMKAKALFEETADDRFLAITLGSLASLKRDKTDYEASEKYLETAINIIKKIRNTEELRSIFLQKLTKLLIYQGRNDEAEGVNQEAMAILSKLKRQVGVAHCKQSQALIYESRENLPLALDYIEESAKLFLLFGAKEDIIKDLNRIRGKAQGDGCSVSNEMG